MIPYGRQEITDDDVRAYVARHGGERVAKAVLVDHLRLAPATVDAQVFPSSAAVKPMRSWWCPLWMLLQPPWNPPRKAVKFPPLKPLFAC